MIEDLITQTEVDAALKVLADKMSDYSSDTTPLGHTIHLMYLHTFEFVKSNFKKYEVEDEKQYELDF